MSDAGKTTEHTPEETQELYRTLLRAMPLGVIIADLEGRIIDVSEQALKDLGAQSVEQLKGRSTFELIPPDKVEQAKQAMQRTIAEGVVEAIEIDIKGADGREYIAELNLALVKDSKGKPVAFVGVGGDITERKKTEEALRQHREELEKLVVEQTEDLAESEQKLRTLFENSPDRIVMTDTTGKVLYINRLVSLKREQVVGVDAEKVLPPEVRREFFAVVEELNAGKDIVEREFEYLGITYWCRFASVRKNGEIEYITVIAKDITEEKKTREEVQRLGQILEASIDNANVWFEVLDENANVVIWNKAAKLISGYTKEELADNVKSLELFYPDKEYREKITQKVMAIIRGEEEANNFITIIRTKSGEKKHISWYARQLLDETGKTIGLVAIGRDITNQRLFAEKLEEAREEERRRLSSELHDDIGQILTLSRIKIDKLRDSQITDPAVFTREISEASNLLADVLEKTRDLSHKLRPPILDQLGLVPAIQALARRFATETGTKIHANTPDESNLHGDMDLLVYRTLQESLTNVAKHSKATEVHLDFAVGDNNLDFEVSDNGIGFDIENCSKRSNCIGIRSMKWAVEDKGGELLVMSEPGAGTTIKASVPISALENRLSEPE